MDDRKVLVTGGASGIGREVARLLVEHGATVTVLDRNGKAVERVATEIGARYAVADITDEIGIADAVERSAASMGRLDTLIHAAGIVTLGPVTETRTADWTHTLAVNLTGAFLTCRAAVPLLRCGEAPTIVTVASAQGLIPGANASAYAASKGGLIAFTKALAAELAPTVRVNTVCPGLVATPMTASLFDDRALDEAAAAYALKRAATPREIAEAIAFLSGPQSSIITGVALAADGGRTFH